MSRTLRANDASRAVEDAEEQARISAATPTKYEVIEALGADGYTERPDGTWEYAVTREHWAPEKNRRRIRIVNEMMRKKRILETERSMRRGETDGKVKLRLGDGRVREVPPHMEEAMARKGARPVIFWGRKST